MCVKSVRLKNLKIQIYLTRNGKKWCGKLFWWFWSAKKKVLVLLCSNSILICASLRYSMAYWGNLQISRYHETKWLGRTWKVVHTCSPKTKTFNKTCITWYVLISTYRLNEIKTIFTIKLIYWYETPIRIIVRVDWALQTTFHCQILFENVDRFVVFTYKWTKSAKWQIAMILNKLSKINLSRV